MSLSAYFYDPFSDNSSFFSEFNRLFDAAFDARTCSSAASNNKAVTQDNAITGILRPRYVTALLFTDPWDLRYFNRMDFHESKDNNEFTATFELPGMKKEDVTIDVHDNRLIVSGHSSLSNELEKDGYAIRERKYGKFSRTLNLPVGIKVSACLSSTVPKS